LVVRRYYLSRFIGVTLTILDLFISQYITKRLFRVFTGLAFFIEEVLTSGDVACTSLSFYRIIIECDCIVFLFCSVERTLYYHPQDRLNSFCC